MTTTPTAIDSEAVQCIAEALQESADAQSAMNRAYTAMTRLAAFADHLPERPALDEWRALAARGEESCGALAGRIIEYSDRIGRAMTVHDFSGELLGG